MRWGWCGTRGNGTLRWADRARSTFRLAKPKTERHGLSFGPICANQSANTRGSACGGVGVVVEAVACCVGPIERRARFGWQNRKPSHMGSVLVQAGRFQLAYVQGTRTVICVPYFEPWAYAIMRGWATVCETTNKMLNHLKC